MFSCCCSNSMCSWESMRSPNRFTGADVSGLVDEAEQNTVEQSRMDIALLREQYRWTKDKQKRQTQVVLYRQAPDTAPEAGGGGASLVRLVPVCQSRRGSLESLVSEDQVNLPPQDPHLAASLLDANPWRTHLGIHRRTCLANIVTPPHANLHTTTTTTTTSSGASSSTLCPLGSPCLSESCSRSSAGEHAPSWTSTTSRSFDELDSRMSGESRKCSASAVLSRQLSFGGYHHPQPLTPPCSTTPHHHHYPFPQRKTLRKSEAARRLGMYSSF